MTPAAARGTRWRVVARYLEGGTARYANPAEGVAGARVGTAGSKQSAPVHESGRAPHVAAIDLRWNSRPPPYY